MSENNAVLNAKIIMLSRVREGDLIASGLGSENILSRSLLAREMLLNDFGCNNYFLAKLQALLIGLDFTNIAEKVQLKQFYQLHMGFSFEITLLKRISANWVSLYFKDQSDYSTFITHLVKMFQISNTGLDAEEGETLNIEGLKDIFLHNPIMTFLYVIQLTGMLSPIEQQVLLNKRITKTGEVEDGNPR